MRASFASGTRWHCRRVDLVRVDTARYDLVAQLYADLTRGEHDAFVDALAKDVEWVVPVGFPYAGLHVGRDAVRDVVLTSVESRWDGFAVVPQEIQVAGATVFVLGYYSGVHLETERFMRARFAHVWRFRDGVPWRFEAVVDTQPMAVAAQADPQGPPRMMCA
jgi:ketosteroid isomerase-like protein